MSLLGDLAHREPIAVDSPPVRDARDRRYKNARVRDRDALANVGVEVVQRQADAGIVARQFSARRDKERAG